jgi:hypothetical protein
MAKNGRIAAIGASLAVGVAGVAHVVRDAGEDTHGLAHVPIPSVLDPLNAVHDASDQSAVEKGLREWLNDGGAQRLVVQTFCSQATGTINNDPSQEDWRTNFAQSVVDTAEQETAGIATDVVQEKADQFSAVVKLLQGPNGVQTARVYVKACNVVGPE